MMISCAVHLEAHNESLHFQICGVLAYSLTEVLVTLCIVNLLCKEKIEWGFLPPLPSFFVSGYGSDHKVYQWM